MSDVAQKLICLSLNKLWQPIGYKTVKDAIIQLCGGSSESDESVLALDIDYPFNEFGEPMLDSPSTINPVKWEDWMQLPIRPWDLTINTANRSFRVPTVIVNVNYGKMPMRMFKGKPTREALWNRDNGTCQYTGKKVTKDNSNIDHIVPRSKGGKDTWTNMVLSCKDINTRKGNASNQEIGLKLIREPKAPSPTPVSQLITDAKHADWKHFIQK